MEHLFSSRNKKRGKMISPFFPLCLTLLLVFSTFLLPPLGQSAQVSLAWDNSTDPTVASYKIYTGTSSGSYSQNTNVGFANPYTVTNLTEGKTYYFAATALGSNGLESGYSNQVSYTVPLAQTIYTITASAGANGSISPSGAVLLTQGLSQTFTITPNSNYKIAGVTVDGVSVGAVSSYTFSNVTAAHTISASFVQNPSSYTITVSAGANGSISPSGSVSVTQGSSQTFTITPNANYKISGVTVDGVSVGAVSSYTFSNVTAAHTISASFVQNITSYTVTASAGANGSISPSGSVSVTQGSSQTFSITPNANYKISGVTVDGVSVGAVSSYTFSNVTAAHTISASFVQNITSYTVTASAGANGSISPSGSVSVTQGSSQTFSITPNANYKISGVTVDGVSVGAVGSYTFSNVTAPHTISAIFSQNSTTITASAGANGSISPSGTVTVNQGSSQTFTITPNTNYKVAGVTVDGLSVGAVGSYTFSNVTAPHTISASFAQNITSTTITASAGANGSISPSGTVTVNQGSSQTFTITPNANYKIAGVTVDGASVGAVGSYTFSNVTAPHTISASFAQNITSTTITASAGANGSISPSGTVTVNQGSSQTFTITPNTNYKVAGVTVDGLSVGAVGSYTFSNVTAPHTISASFSQNQTAALKLVTPNGGEILKRGTKVTIGWVFAGSVGTSIKIELMNGSWVSKTVTGSTSTGNNGQGSYSWTIPTTVWSGSNYKFRITSLSNGQYKDRSDSSFTITR
jgi:hypothetical protein